MHVVFVIIQYVVVTAVLLHSAISGYAEYFSAALAREPTQQQRQSVKFEL